MNEKKWTKGEWSVPHFARPEVNCQCSYVLSDHQMGAICTVHCSGEGDWRVTGDNPGFEEAVANAHLIAATPDLYEALEEARTFVAFAFDQGVVGAYEAGIQLDAALAKARGERHG